jgi:HlyD family secretion protein
MISPIEQGEEVRAGESDLGAVRTPVLGSAEVRRKARGSSLNVLRKKWFILILAVVAIAVVSVYALRSKEKPQYFTAKSERGDLRAVVEATGTINAVTTVQVGSQVSGTIQQLFADFNSKVKKGQVVARIDPSLFQGNLMQAKADLDNAKANLAAAQANLAKSKAAALQTKQDLDRTKSLAQAGVMSQQQLDLAQANYDSAEAQVNASQAAVGQAAAGVKQRQAAVDVAQTNLDHTVIVAPIDGTVVARSVDVGQTVAASLQAPTLFTIAQDLTKMQVYAKTDESDVGMIHPGQKVTFKVDAFPKDSFTGQVVQVRMNATTVQNVVTYDTIVEFENPETKLFPGMTAYVTIPVQQASDVLKVPNGALRYKPDLKPDELKALLAKYGMDQGGQRSQSAQSAEAQTAPTAQPGADTSTARAQGGRQGQQAQGAQFGSEAARRRQAVAPGDQTGGATPDDKQPRQAKPEMATLWKLHAGDKSLEPVRVRIGITDHTMTEVVQVLKGELKEGDELVIGSSARGASTGAAGAARPGAAPGGAGIRR